MQRHLTPGEREIARSVFGVAIDYNRVTLRRAKYFPFQPVKTVMAPDGHIWFHPKGQHWSDDFAAESVKRQGLFIHEMTHVWQRRKGIFLPLKRHPFCRYSYSIKPGWTLERYGLEQQAEIVRHVFLLRAGVAVAGVPDRTQMESILPFQGQGSET